jgi:hypothetical protein
MSRQNTSAYDKDKTIDGALAAAKEMHVSARFSQRRPITEDYQDATA